MLKTLLVFIVSIFLQGLLFGQAKVKITHQIDDDELILMAENIADQDFQFRFSFSVVELEEIALKKKIRIPSGESRQVARYKIKDIGWSYNYRYKYQRYFYEGTMNAIASKLKINPEEAMNSIIVFDRDDCYNCDRITEYLEAKKIEHHVLNILEDKENEELMWACVYDLGYNLSSIRAPLVVIGGKTRFNIKDFRALFKSMRLFAKEKGLK